MGVILNSTLVIIPALNAEDSIKELINRLRREVKDVQIVLVDDGSMDHTSEIARSLGVTVLRHEKNSGKGAALQTGFDFAQSQTKIEFVLTMDADLQHRPEDVKGFFELQEKTNADMVVGWRKRIGTRMPLHRIISNTLTSTFVSIKTGVKIRDSQCGFRFIRRKVFETIQLDTKGFEAETEFLIKAARSGYKIEFVPVRTVYGNEKSYMTHWATTKNFIKVLLRDYP